MRRAESEDGAQRRRWQEVSVEELVREMEGIKGWQLVDGCISVEGPGTAPGFCMCPIVAVHWFRMGRRMWFTQSRLALGLGVKAGVRILKAADGVPGHDSGLRRRMMEAVGLGNG